MSPTQSCMARTGLRWGERQLAFHAGVGIGDVRRFEAGKTIVSDRLAAMQGAMLKAGATFFSEIDGVRGDGVHIRERA